MVSADSRKTGMKLRLALFTAMIMLALALGLLPSTKWTGRIFHSCGYYFMFSAFLLWVVTILSHYPGRILPMLKKHCGALFLSFVLMASLFVISPPKYKILADEANLLGVSLSMYNEKASSLTLEIVSVDDKRQIKYGPTKRPLLYSALVSFCHSLTGYRAENGFAVNFIFGFLSLFCIYLTAVRYFSKALAFLAMLIFAGCPIFCFWSTSAGFETLNLFFVLFVFAVLGKFLADKQAADLEILFFSLVLLAQCRYESALYTIAMVFMLPLVLKKDIVEKLSPTILFVPFLFVTVLWQRRMFSDYVEPIRIAAENYQFESTAFHLGLFWTNVKKNLFVLSGFDPNYGFSPFLFLLFLLGGYLAIKRLLLSHSEISPGKKWFFGYVLVTLLLQTTIIFTYKWGDFTSPVANRFAMVFLPYLAFPVLFFVRELKDNRILTVRLAMLLAVFHMIWFRPYAAEENLTKNLALTHEYDRVLEYLKSNLEDEKQVLIISAFPNLYAIHKYNSIHIVTANREPERFRFLSKVHYDRTLVVQKFSRETGKPIEGERLPGYVQKPLKTIKIGPEIFVKISELHTGRQGWEPE